MLSSGSAAAAPWGMAAEGCAGLAKVAKIRGFACRSGLANLGFASGPSKKKYLLKTEGCYGKRSIYPFIIDGLPVKNMWGWWLTYPSGKYEFVIWDYEIPNIWKVIEFHGSKPPARIRNIRNISKNS